MREWRRDVLGDGFECTDLALGADDEGELVATLVRSLPRRLGFWERTFVGNRMLEHVDVLYVHGWNDYFYQRRLAEFWTGRGARFYALDLRKYGRSLRNGQTAGDVRHLDEYDEEIELALAEMGHPALPAADAPQGRRLILLGHSTGGLVLSLWAHRHRGVADALILNSPWLELQASAAVRRAVAPMLGLHAKLNPRDLALPQLDLGFYTRALKEVSDPSDTADLDPAWRAELAGPVRAGWLNAVLEGHARVAAGLDVGAPAVVFLSARSAFGVTWRDEMGSADTVLEVEGIARAALRLGPTVVVERVEGALHDVFISRPAVRDEAYARLDRVVRGWIAVPPRD